MPAAVTYNPSTKTCMVRDNVRQLEVVGDTGNGINGLRNLMQENGVTDGSTVSPDVPVIPPVDPDDPELPSYPNNSTSIPNVHPYAWEVLRLVNQRRMGMGLQPLSVFTELQQAANIRAVELYTYCEHTRPDGSNFATVFTQLGITLTSAAENIASGQHDAADVMDSWLNSSGHRANIENPNKTHLGVGYYYNSDHPHRFASNWVQNFIAASNCSFSGMKLSKASIAGEPGTDLETLLAEADIEVTANCYRHGLSSLPLIAAMCSGYDVDANEDQTLTVTYGGQTAMLTITGAQTGPDNP
ncbi:MAG: hypothetical protein K2P04_08335, partial [Oscillospiraceae bacterium]|nr:hypothetical protein [Oscillospiraceae bacterium]